MMNRDQLNQKLKTPLELHKTLLWAVLLIISLVSPVYADGKTQGYYQNGVDALAKGELQKAEMWFIRAYRSDKTEHTGYEELLTIYEIQQRYEKSLELVDKEIAHRGVTANLLTSKGLILVNLGQIEEAQPYYLRAGSLAPNDPQVLLSIEQYLVTAGKTQQANTYKAQRAALEAQ